MLSPGDFSNSSALAPIWLKHNKAQAAFIDLPLSGGWRQGKLLELLGTQRAVCSFVCVSVCVSITYIWKKAPERGQKIIKNRGFARFCANPLIIAFCFLCYHCVGGHRQRIAAAAVGGIQDHYGIIGRAGGPIKGDRGSVACAVAGLQMAVGWVCIGLHRRAGRIFHINGRRPDFCHASGSHHIEAYRYEPGPVGADTDATRINIIVGSYPDRHGRYSAAKSQRQYQYKRKAPAQFCFHDILSYPIDSIIFSNSDLLVTPEMLHSISSCSQAALYFSVFLNM